MYNTDFSQFSNTGDIDKAFAIYVNKKNNSAHSSLEGRTPLNVFMEDAQLIRRVESDYLERVFYHTATRKVANDATVKLNTKIYETKQEYIGTRVTLKYKPDLSSVYFYYDEKYIEIYEVNKVENSRIKRNKPLFSEDEE